MPGTSRPPSAARARAGRFTCPHADSSGRYTPTPNTCPHTTMQSSVGPQGVLQSCRADRNGSTEHHSSHCRSIHAGARVHDDRSGGRCALSCCAECGPTCDCSHVFGGWFRGVRCPRWGPVFVAAWGSFCLCFRWLRVSLVSCSPRAGGRRLRSQVISSGVGGGVDRATSRIRARASSVRG